MNKRCIQHWKFLKFIYKKNIHKNHAYDKTSTSSSSFFSFLKIYKNLSFLRTVVVNWVLSCYRCLLLWIKIKTIFKTSLGAFQFYSRDEWNYILCRTRFFLYFLQFCKNYQKCHQSCAWTILVPISLGEFQKLREVLNSGLDHLLLEI